MESSNAVGISLKQSVDKFFESPSGKTLFSSVMTLAFGVFSSAFVVEISTSTGVVWSSFYKTFSFYVLLALVVLFYFYHKAVYKRETEMMRFMDDDYCIAYMRSKCLPEAAEKYKGLIRSGQGGELAQAMEELRRVLR